MQRISLWLAILFICISGSAFARTTPNLLSPSGDPSSPGAPGAAVAMPGIGVDYFVYDTGTYTTLLPISASNNWTTPGRNFKTPIGLYNLNPLLVNSQLAQMRASGMDWVSIVISMDNFNGCETNGACSDGFVDGIWGETNDYSSSALPPQEQTNLANMLAQIVSLGFRHVVIRFGNYTPGMNGVFDEANYQKAWNAIVGTRAIVYQALNGTITKPLFDLDLEGPGSPDVVRQQYDNRLWSDYTYSFGSSDTVGFSIIGESSHLTNGLPIFSNTKPAIYAFDIYGDVGQGLLAAWNALGSEQSKPIMLMETYSNDAQTSSELQQLLAAHPGIHLVSLIQWQRTRAVPCAGCDTNITMSAVDSLNQSNQVSNYEPILAKLAIETTNAAAINVTDVNCSTTSAATCTVAATFNTSGLFQAYARMPGHSAVLMTCGTTSGQSNIDWIQRNTVYQFDIYQTSTCSTPITGLTPAASAVISARY